MRKKIKDSEPSLDSNFIKVRPQMLADLFDATNSKTGVVLSHLLSQLNYSNNTVITTNEEIVKDISKKTDSKISYKTVVKTMQTLEDKNFIKRRRGAIMFNPVLIVKGRHEKEYALSIEYDSFNNQKIEEGKVISTERAPVVFNDSITLILGDHISLEDYHTGQYYSDQNDYFWDFISAGTGTDIKDLKNDYQNQIEFLKRTRFALWYMSYQNIDIQGNRSKVLNEYENDLENFMKEHPQIKLIMCNGSKTYKKLQIYLKERDLKLDCDITCLDNSNGARGAGNDKYEAYKNNWAEFSSIDHYQVIETEYNFTNPEEYHSPIYDAYGNITNNATGRFDHLVDEYKETHNQHF